MDVKRCGECGQEKPITSFTKRSGRSGRRGTCRSCLRKRGRSADESAVTASDIVGESVMAAIAGESSSRLLEETKRAELRAGHVPPEQPEAAESDSSGLDGDTSSQETDGDQTVKKRKRKRRRRRRGRSQADQTQIGDESETSEREAEPASEEDPDSQDEEDEVEAGQEPAEPVESAGDGDTPQKKKRRRRRRRRKSKNKQVNTSSLLPEGGEKLGFDWKVPSRPGGRELALVTGHSLPSDALEANEADTAEEESDAPKRKRKRRRRRKRRVNAGIPQEAEVKPQVRPPYKRIVPIKGPFTYDPALLNDRGTGLIRLRGRRETGKRWSTEIPTEMAIRMVQEGAAGIINPTLIHKLYTKTDFRLLILQRDDYICKYCGRFGDTIDHVMPKSKGGLSTPDNCVCACAECNLRKADHLDFVFDEL